MVRLWRALSGQPKRVDVDLGRLQAVRPAAKRGRRRGGGETPFSAWDLRVILALIPVRLSGRRRAAALAPLAAAALAWFTIPSWASTISTVSAQSGSTGHRLADVLSSVACPPPAPVVGISGPSAVGIGQTATFTVTVQRQDSDLSAPSVVDVTVPDGFGFANPPAGGSVSGQTLTLSYDNTAPAQVATLHVGVTAPGTPSSQNLITVTDTATTAGDSRCPSRQAISQSSVKTDVVTSGVQGTTVSGPLGVAASESGLPGGTLRSPVTGINTGMLRTLTIGFCLMLSGVVVLGGIRRNPHADALAGRRERWV